MTTIVYYRGQVAFDSRVTQAGKVCTDRALKRTKRDGHTFWLAGALASTDALITAYLTGKPATNGDAQALVLKPDGSMYQLGFEEDGTVWACAEDGKEPVALGSGGALAITAIDCGLDIRSAVKMACKRDLYSGGLIRVDSVC